MKTLVLPINEESILLAKQLLEAGEVVAFPTETVYGLGANAFNEAAVKKIFEVKGRPNDNPLIVHVADKIQVNDLVLSINENTKNLMDNFMPGPITVVMPKSEKVPMCVTAGGDTVGIRIPENKDTQRFLKAVGLPIAAPSANSSGKPSPTTAKHVLDDLDGKIPLILDGGECSGGVESTVISACTVPAMLLRPGLVTVEMLENVLGKITIHPSVLEAGKVDKAASPGMKYKHYSPNARVLIVDGNLDFSKRIYDNFKTKGKNPVIFWNEIDNKDGYNYYEFYSKSAKQAAKNLFALLRKADDEHFDVVLVKKVSNENEGLSVMNRLLRASAFTVINEDMSIDEINRLI